jgi:hypothetical protein
MAEKKFLTNTPFTKPPTRRQVPFTCLICTNLVSQKEKVFKYTNDVVSRAIVERRTTGMPYSTFNAGERLERFRRLRIVLIAPLRL